MEKWWRRVFALFPNATFDLKAIVSIGTPWNTKVMTYLTIADQIPTGKNGTLEPYQNEFMQLAQIKGQMQRLRSIHRCAFCIA